MNCSGQKFQAPASFNINDPSASNSDLKNPLNGTYQTELKIPDNEDYLLMILWT